MKKLSQTTQFGKDIKRMRKRGKNLEKLKTVVNTLMRGIPLKRKHKDHPLIGPWKNARDCHIEPNWVLIYTTNTQILHLERTGTHSDLFKK